MSYLHRYSTGLNDIQYYNPLEAFKSTDLLDKNLAPGYYHIDQDCTNSPVTWGLLIAINIMRSTGNVRWYWRIAIGTNVFDDPTSGAIYGNMANNDTGGSWQGWTQIGAALGYLQMLKIIAGEA